jgi:hypothetical protein
MTLKIFIEPTKLGQKGQRYQVTFEDEVILEDTSNPEYDACRVLLSRGITGRLETWRRNLPYPCLILDIEKAAKLTVRDNRFGVPVACKYSPNP